MSLAVVKVNLQQYKIVYDQLYFMPLAVVKVNLQQYKIIILPLIRLDSLLLRGTKRVRVWRLFKILMEGFRSLLMLLKVLDFL